MLFVANAIWLKESPREIGFDQPTANPLNVYGETTAASDPPTSLRDLLQPLLTSPEFLVVCLLSFGLTLMRETFNVWTPTYFQQVVGSICQAAVQFALFPLLGGASVLLAGWLGDRLGPSGRASVILAGCSLAGLVLWTLGSFDFSGRTVAAVSLAVAAVSFLMLGPYSYLAGAISLDLGGKRRAATACGIIDGVGYLGGLLAGYAVAWISLHYGWSGVFRALAAVAALTSLAAPCSFSFSAENSLANSPRMCKPGLPGNESTDECRR